MVGMGENAPGRRLLEESIRVRCRKSRGWLQLQHSPCFQPAPARIIYYARCLENIHHTDYSHIFEMHHRLPEDVEMTEGTLEMTGVQPKRRSSHLILALRPLATTPTWLRQIAKARTHS